MWTVPAQASKRCIKFNGLESWVPCTCMQCYGFGGIQWLRGQEEGFGAGVSRKFIFVHLKGGGHRHYQNWLKFGPRSCWMTPLVNSKVFTANCCLILCSALNPGPLEKWTVHSNNSHFMKFPSRPGLHQTQGVNDMPGLYNCPLKYSCFSQWL